MDEVDEHIYATHFTLRNRHCPECMSSVVILVLMFVMFCHFVIEVNQEVVNYENICFIGLEYIVMRLVLEWMMLFVRPT